MLNTFKDLQKKPQITTIQRQEMPGEKEEEEDKLAQMKPEANLLQPKKQPEEEDKDKLAQKKPEIISRQQDKQPEEEEKEKKIAQMQPLVQRRSSKGSTAATADVESSIEQARGQGRPLPDNVRGSMEQAFGADFTDVRVHTDTHADQINRSIQARAFTTGKDVFFRRGEFALGSKRGQELLAHELTHVVQQNGSAVQPKSLTKQEKKKENKLQSKTKFNQSAEQTAIPEQDPHSAPLAAKAAPADASQPEELVQQQTLVAEAGSGEVEVQHKEASGGTAPTSPEADGEFQAVVSQSQDSRFAYFKIELLNK